MYCCWATYILVDEDKDVLFRNGISSVCLALMVLSLLVRQGNAGLQGQYYNTDSLSSLATIRVDDTVNFSESDWADCPPGTEVICDDAYSERWTGYVHIETSGDWTFHTYSNDGVRLWVDGTQIINHWNQHTATWDSATVTLDARWYPIKLEHFQNGGTVVIQLHFEGPGQSRVIVPSSRTSPTSPGYPIADAGPDRYLILPGNSTSLTGSGTDSDGTIVSYNWDKLSGPCATMSGANTTTLVLSDLVEGTYQFRLTVTDNDDLKDSDDCILVVSRAGSEATVEGELKTWHRVTITFSGPMTSEADTPNPFTDYRLRATFTGPAGQVYDVPGFYAADGDAAETSATAGNKWRIHFVPDQEGQWDYVASFRAGPMVNISLEPDAGSSAGYFDGAAGSFIVGPTDKSGDDFRAKGMLRYVGRHHLQFAGTGDYYLKGGADSPENFLGYFEFDGTYDNGRLSPSTPDSLHHYEPHVIDWNPGDPTWQGDKGKGIIGAINYLSSRGANSIYFLTYNLDGGDGMDSWIWTDHDERWRIDVSKLAQWEIVFAHMDAKAVQLHVVTSEAENHGDLGGGFSDMRRLYYRELVARFSHHHAIIWNIGEENGNSDGQRKAFAAYIRAIDPYDHPITVHTYSGRASTFYNGILGDPHFEATSIQGSGSSYNAWTIELREKSAGSGRKWAIYGDEQGPAVNKSMNNLDTLRKGALWGNLMGGGAGVEWYFGYQGDFADCGSEDWHVAEPLWDMTKVALDFFQNHLPFWDMDPDNSLTSATNDYCLAIPGEIYAIYLPSGGTTDLSLLAGTYGVKWYDPRIGGDLQEGSVTNLAGPGWLNVGQPPANASSDWVVLVAAETTASSADVNGDGRVDWLDLVIMVADWLRCNDPADPSCQDALGGQFETAPAPVVDSPPAGVQPVTNIEAGQNGSPPYLLESITVGSYAVSVHQLRTGTSTGYAGFGTEITAADDFDLNNIAARNEDSQPLWQITKIGGEPIWRNSNADNPDFFIFEAGMNDNIELRVIMARGVLGQAVYVSESTWGDTGLNKVGSPNDGQDIGGLALAITDLKDANGLRLTNSNVIEGIQVTSGTLDPSCFCALAPLGLVSGPPVVDAGQDVEAFLQPEIVIFQLDAVVTDDGKPDPLIVTWTVDSQPAASTVVFDPHVDNNPATANIVNPTVSVDAVGTYVLRLTANDGESSVYDQVRLSVVEPACEYIRNHRMLFRADLSGSIGIPDCRVDFYDFAFLADCWRHGDKSIDSQSENASNN
jgi:hypothetical protein